MTQNYLKVAIVFLKMMNSARKLKQYIYVLKKKLNEKSFGKLSIISETLQRCFLRQKTAIFFKFNKRYSIRLYNVFIFFLSCN